MKLVYTNTFGEVISISFMPAANAPEEGFDSETNTTYYHLYDRLDGNTPTGSKQWLPPRPAETMRIAPGNEPIPQYDSNGNRIVTEGDITKLYHQYLDRAPDEEGLNYWLNTGDSLEKIESDIQVSAEGSAANAQGKWRDKVYYNPQTYGTETSITARLKEKPADIQAPNITINSITPTKPTKAWMSHGNKVWTDPSVDTRPSQQGGN